MAIPIARTELSLGKFKVLSTHSNKVTIPGYEYGHQDIENNEKAKGEPIVEVENKSFNENEESGESKDRVSVRARIWMAKLNQIQNKKTLKMFTKIVQEILKAIKW